MYQVTILKSIIEKSDGDAIDVISHRSEWVFTEEKYLELYKIIEKHYIKNDKVPDKRYLHEFFRLEKDNPAKEAWKEVRTHKETTDSVSSMVELQLKLNLKKDLKTNLKRYNSRLATLNMSEIDELLEEMGETVGDMKVVLDTENNKKALLFGEGAQDRITKRYQKAKDNKDYFICKYGIPEIDEHVGGITKTDYLFILGYVKQFKSTVGRFITYQALLQGKNVAVLSLEMSFEAIETAYYVLHANNVKRFGAGNPKITMQDVNLGQMTPEQEEFFFGTVVPDFTSAPDLGNLYIVQPSASEGQYTVDEMFADVRKVHKNIMPIDILFVDYISLLSPSKTGKIDREAVNAMIRRIRGFNLSFENHNGMTIISPAQTNRKGFEDAEKDGKYHLTAIGDYNAIERDTTRVIAVLQTEEMKKAKEIQLQQLAARESSEFPMFRMTIDGATGWMYSSSGIISDEDTIEILDDLDI